MIQPHAADESEGYTFCDGCNGVPFCGIRFWSRDGVVTRIAPWPDFPTPALCAKAYGTLQRLRHPDRLLHPLRRTTPKGQDPRWERISWDAAYDLAAEQLERIRRVHGPHAVFFYVGDPKEPRAAVQRLAAAFGSANYGTESSTACRRAAQLAEQLTYGFPTLGNLPGPLTRSMLIWGTNPAYSGQPYPCHEELAAAKARGVRLVVVDPRQTPTTRLADVHLALRPATDAALAAGLIHVILREGWHDRAFCEHWIHGFDALSAYAAGFTPEVTERHTGVPAAKVVEAARLYARSGPGGLLTSAQSTTHNRNAVNNHRALLLVPAVCGYVDAPGGVAFPGPGLEGMGGPWANGPPAFSLRKELLALRAHRLDLEAFPLWAEQMFEVQTNLLPEWVQAGKVKAFLGWGLNAMIWPETHVYQEALDALDFVLAVDFFERPQTHRHVDLLLPAALNFERRAPFAVFGRRIFGRRPVKPAGEAREDWQIALELGTRLGLGERLFHGDVDQALDAILGQWKVSRADLAAAQVGGVTVPGGGPPAPRAHERGAMRPDGQPGFPTPTGKIQAVSVELERHGHPGLPEYRPPPAPDARFPLRLVSGARLPHITHSKWRKDAPWLDELGSEPLVQVHPDDAEPRGIRDGAPVVLWSAAGELRAQANVTVSTPPGVVSMMHGWAQANVNALVPRELDPISGFPPLKDVICELSVAGGPA
jgi:anaerobic selenocysteine-containing dehydrogenase